MSRRLTQAVLCVRGITLSVRLMTWLRSHLPADPLERRALLRALQALVTTFLGPDVPAVAALRDAENDPAAVDIAARALDKSPTRTVRRLLSVWGRTLEAIASERPST
jgi:hypothetical protein